MADLRARGRHTFRMASGRLINPAFHTGAMTMSDIITSPFDAAIDTLRERERTLDTEAQSLIIRRDEVREMIAVLTSRKPRAPRKPRALFRRARCLIVNRRRLIKTDGGREIQHLRTMQ